ncbi:MAG: hypothetical protein Q8M95_06865 [Candidatus Methanoperedens sp.]|nr:hypothetical protein [Candidatus Methanoperedens sp.]
MGSYDFIYGSKMIIQCQAQINIHNCNNSQDESTKYLILIKKEASFFQYCCKPRRVVNCMVRKAPDEHLDEDILRNVGTNIDDELIERERVLSWSKARGIISHVSHSGHGKMLLKLNAPTFCAREMEIDFDPRSYSYPSSS